MDSKIILKGKDLDLIGKTKIIVRTFFNFSAITQNFYSLGYVAQQFVSINHLYSEKLIIVLS